MRCARLEDPPTCVRRSAGTLLAGTAPQFGHRLELGEHFKGCTLHIFTGHYSVAGQAERYRTAGDLLGMPVEVHALTERGPLEGLRPGRDLVVVITRWGGHSDTEAVQDRCKKARVPCFAMPQHVLDPERVVLELWGKGK